MPVAAKLRPNISNNDAADLAENLFGVKVNTARPLPSERDQNFYIKDNQGKEFVLKIAGSADRSETLDMQNKAMTHLADRIDDSLFPHICATKSGEQIATITAANGHRFFVSLL